MKIPKKKYYAPLDFKIAITVKGDETRFLSHAQEQVTTIEGRDSLVILPVLSYNGNVDEETVPIGAVLRGLGSPN